MKFSSRTIIVSLTAITIFSLVFLVGRADPTNTSFGAELIEDGVPICLPADEIALLKEELTLTTTAFFMATNDAALKLWYEDKLDAIIKKYVPEDRHQDIGREIVALQDEVEATHGALSIGLFKAMEESGIPEAGEMMVQGRDTFQEIYQQTLLLIQAISEVE